MNTKRRTIILKKEFVENLVEPMHEFMVIKYRNNRGQNFKADTVSIENSLFNVDDEGYLTPQ